ncbi:hypothetical protein BC830DRAFT_1171713 [Chytriomyces sp. MP71]|nr:hypothetical protein BC830DRAFT_1171713 [Chytriomyces sp. MP71]
MAAVTFQNRTVPLLGTLNQIRNDHTFADVLLLVGPRKVPIPAHSCFLAATSDYYKEALSVKWARSPDCTAVEASVISSFPRISATLTHPDAEPEVVQLILEYIYCGKVSIPPHHLHQVALFSNLLLLRTLAHDCLNHLITTSLTASNAITLFTTCDQLRCDTHKERALLHIQADMDAALAHGRDTLISMSDAQVRSALLLRSFTALERWTLLVARVKALQGCTDLRVDAAVGEGWDWEQAQEDGNGLLPLVQLFCFAREEYGKYVAPYLEMIPTCMHEFLSVHYGAYEAQWGSDLNMLERSRILGQRLLVALERELKAYIATQDVEKGELKLVHRGSSSNFAAHEFHKAVNGKKSTVSIIKTVNGKILGGFSESAWNASSGYIDTTRAFLFQVLLVDKNEVKVNYFTCKNLNHAVGGRDGLAFGDDLYVAGNSCHSYLGAIFGCYNANGETALSFLGVEKAPAQIEISEYEVFELA